MSDMLMLMLQKAHIACTFLNNISEWTIFLFSAVKFILHDVYFTFRILWSFNPENNGQTQGDTIWKNSTEIEVAVVSISVTRVSVIAYILISFFIGWNLVTFSSSSSSHPVLHYIYGNLQILSL